MMLFVRVLFLCTQKATDEIIRDLNVIYAEKGINNKRYTGSPPHHSLYNDEIQESLSFPDLFRSLRSARSSSAFIARSLPIQILISTYGYHPPFFDLTSV